MGVHGIFTIMITWVLIVTIIMGILGFVIRTKFFNLNEKLNPFECDFDKNPNYRFPLSLRFFLITVIFLLFDIEIVLFLPVPIIINSLNNSIIMLGPLLFVAILILGLLHE